MLTAVQWFGITSEGNHGTEVAEEIYGTLADLKNMLEEDMENVMMTPWKWSGPLIVSSFLQNFVRDSICWCTGCKISIVAVGYLPWMTLALPSGSAVVCHLQKGVLTSGNQQCMNEWKVKIVSSVPISVQSSSHSALLYCSTWPWPDRVLYSS